MKKIHILLVEDNEGDIYLTTEALEEKKIINHISIVKDGQSAIDFIYKRGAYADAKTPDLILLDVNLPKKNGHEVLTEIKSNELTKHIPVIVLTTSSSEKDINSCYQNHANCYITKPVEAEEFLQAISTIEGFWLSIVSLPKNK